MAVIPHVEAGNTALAAEQNALIDQVNSNTSVVATVGTGVFTSVDTVSSWSTAAQSAIDSLRSEVYGGTTRTGKPKFAAAVTTNASPYFQTLNYSTDTMLNWQTEVRDTDAMFTPGQSGVTVPVSGFYLSQVSLNLVSQTGTVTGSCALKLYQNTTNPDPNAAGNVTNVLGTNTAPWNYAGEGPVVTLNNIVQLSAGAVLRVAAWHNFNNGANLNVGVKGGFNAKGTMWTVTYLGK